jgi:DNA-binding NtrC family response regulator
MDRPSPTAAEVAPVSVQRGTGPQVAGIRRRLLLVDDDRVACRQLQHLLEADSRIRVDTRHDGRDALRALAEHTYSLVVTDLKMPHLDGMELLQDLQARRIPVTVIVLTGHGSIDQAVQAMRLGAYDFLTKPIDVEHLRLVVERALRERSLQDEVVYLREQLGSRHAFQNILSKNPRMHAIFELINNVANTTTTVLIEGETGTGKEEVARAIHHTSQVRAGPLIPVNCAALPETLLESELFGHEKGAFTSAVSRRIGRFELAHGGTIFLDEVGDVPATMQAKLLRVLQGRCFERVGGTERIEVDVRVITATNRSLQRLVREGTFREDLYYRLNVVKIDLPPLRERAEDIPLLATHFATKYAKPGEPPKRIAAPAMAALLRYHWPGNVRELENAIERACVTSLNGQIQIEALPLEVVQREPLSALTGVDLKRPLVELLKEHGADLERHYIRKALERSHGNVGLCAKLCGLSRRSISAKIAEYRIDKTEFKHL